MARSLDTCLLCDSYPCICGKKTAPPRRKPEPKSEPKTEPARAPSALAAMREAALRPPPPPPPRKKISYTLSQEDLEWVDGIKVAMRLLGATFVDFEDDKRYAALLAEKDSPELRAYLWRMKRETRNASTCLSGDSDPA